MLRAHLDQKRSAPVPKVYLGTSDGGNDTCKHRNPLDAYQFGAEYDIDGNTEFSARVDDLRAWWCITTKDSVHELARDARLPSDLRWRRWPVRQVDGEPRPISIHHSPRC